MNQVRSKLTVFGATALVVILLDQLTKYWVRTTPELHSYTLIEGWLAFNFTKNPGMALGIHWADTWVISLIAILATVIILVYVWKTMNAAKMGYMACMGLIVGGALGNITDRIFMARVGGYGGVLDGHVVDFIHFKLRIGSFDVFPYIFNVADIAISVSIITLILFYKKLMPEYAVKREDADVSETPGDSPDETRTETQEDSPDEMQTETPEGGPDETRRKTPSDAQNETRPNTPDDGPDKIRSGDSGPEEQESEPRTEKGSGAPSRDPKQK